MRRGGQSDLRFACDFADRIANTVEKLGHEETLRDGFRIFRARNDYDDREYPERGQVNPRPLSEQDVCAPPKEKVGLGRFNAPGSPVLYVSTTPEVALAEIRALPKDPCTLADFLTMRPLRVAKLLEHGREPLGVLTDENPTDEMHEKWLLARTADFVSQRVAGHDRELHYRTCNLIGSAFKEHGFDGLVYRTSFWSPGWRDKSNAAAKDNALAANIVFFDPEAAKPKSSALYSIDWKRPSVEVAGNSSWTAPQ